MARQEYGRQFGVMANENGQYLLEDLVPVVADMLADAKANGVENAVAVFPPGAVFDAATGRPQTLQYVAWYGTADDGAEDEDEEGDGAEG